MVKTAQERAVVAERAMVVCILCFKVQWVMPKKVTVCPYIYVQKA